MEEQVKRLAGIISRVLGIPAETVAGYAESDEASKDLSKAFKDFRTKADSDGYTRAEGKVKDDVEKALKKAGLDKPDFEALADGLDQLKSSAASNGGASLTAEEVLKHPAVKAKLTEVENEKMQAVNAARKEGETELTQKRQEFLKEQQDAKVEAQARAVIAELNPNLNPDSAKAQRQIARLVADIKSGTYKVEADGSLSPVDAEGKYLDNGAGGNKSFSEYVRDTVTSEYDLPEAKKRDAPGSGQPAAATGLIKTKEEYDAAYIKNQADSAALDKLEAEYPQFSK